MPTSHRPAEPQRRAVAPDARTGSDPVIQELWRVKDERAERFSDARTLVQHLRKKFPQPKPGI
jgi:hypothetical protein